MPAVIARPRSLALSLVALGAAACLGETTLVTPPKAPATTITLTFKADSEDLATAAALGWADGIPDVAVTVTPEDSSSPPQHLQGSATGEVTLDQLARGSYVVDGARWRTDPERARLPAGDDAVGFVTRLPLNTAWAAGNVSPVMAASRRHGLVISEFKGDPIEVPNQPQGAYYFSGYLRLYNNGDTTMYLDGFLVGSGLAQTADYPNFPCSAYLSYTFDPLGVWAAYFHRLPGGGRDYPLPPGKTAVLATDGIDHRPLYPIGLDLSHADFEFYAAASDVDNPDVPNAADVGVRSHVLGHGLVWNPFAKVAWVARPTDSANLPTQVVPVEGQPYARIPASALVDVMATQTTYPTGYPLCPYLVHPNFDRQAVRLLGTPFRDDTLAYRRLQLPFTISGRPVLQYTGTSAWDFTIRPRSPFSTP